MFVINLNKVRTETDKSTYIKYDFFNEYSRGSYRNILGLNILEEKDFHENRIKFSVENFYLKVIDSSFERMDPIIFNLPCAYPYEIKLGEMHDDVAFTIRSPHQYVNSLSYRTEKQFKSFLLIERFGLYFANKKNINFSESDKNPHIYFKIIENIVSVEKYNTHSIKTILGNVILPVFPSKSYYTPLLYIIEKLGDSLIVLKAGNILYMEFDINYFEEKSTKEEFLEVEKFFLAKDFKERLRKKKKNIPEL